MSSLTSAGLAVSEFEKGLNIGQTISRKALI
jgi:hypothetical protein